MKAVFVQQDGLRESSCGLGEEVHRHQSAWPEPSEMISTSDGPAIMSMPTVPNLALAAAT